MPDLLFIYGTLHPDRAPREIAAAAGRLIPRGPATIQARVYNLGGNPGNLGGNPGTSDAYPGAILNPAARPLDGELFAIPDAATLAALDSYEDFRPHHPAASLFLRVETTATAPDGTCHLCWVYVYNDVCDGQADSVESGQPSSAGM